MNKAEKYWEILLKNIQWIQFSDTKATVIITVYGIIITLVYTNPHEAFNSLKDSNILIFFTILSCILSALSIFFAFKTLNPKLTNDNPKSIIYFGHIQSKFDNYQDYKKYSSSILENEEEYTDQVSEQVYVTSQIAWNKFKHASYSIRFFIASLAVIMIEIGIYLLSQ